MRGIQTRKPNKIEEVQRHYVYLYRDRSGRAMYVGYGKAESRATSHLTITHNQRLRTFLAHKNYSIEIAGPFASEQLGKTVETALISALRPILNAAPGDTRWQFRPLGVPEAYAPRLLEPPLRRKDFRAAPNARGRCPAILVRISSQQFDDGRVGYSVAKPPSDGQIVERMTRWWQLGRYIEGWVSRPSASPKLLIGISGSPGAQIIIGSLRINPRGWATTARDGALAAVPVLAWDGIDAAGLRGRRLDRQAGIRFGVLRSQQFAILLPDGRVLGGQRPGRHRRRSASANAAAVAFFSRALRYVRREYPEDMDWIRGRTGKVLVKMRVAAFLAEYTWVVYAAGFKVDVLRRKWSALRRAFADFNMQQLMRMRTPRAALKVINNQRKAESLLRGVHQISTEGFSNFKRRILAEGPTALAGLPGIGPITKDHLARNIGLASLAKDDIWIQRVRKAFGFADKDAFADLLARRFRLPPGLVDFVIWQYCADRAWKPDGYPSLEAACHGPSDSGDGR